MANEKVFQSRIQLKHDIEENWSKATNFIPKIGEIIIYDIDENNSIARFKIGDGITNINSLPFVSHHEVISYLPQELTEEQQMQARENLELYRKKKEPILITQVGPDTPGHLWDITYNLSNETGSSAYTIEIWDANPEQLREKFNFEQQGRRYNSGSGGDIYLYWYGNLNLIIQNDTAAATLANKIGYTSEQQYTDVPFVLYKYVDEDEGIDRKWCLFIDSSLTPLYWIGFIVKIFSDKTQTVYYPVPEEYIPDTIARINQLPEAQIQVDYNQNNINEISYIQNRPFYSVIENIVFLNDAIFGTNTELTSTCLSDAPLPDVALMTIGDNTYETTKQITDSGVVYSCEKGTFTYNELENMWNVVLAEGASGGGRTLLKLNADVETIKTIEPKFIDDTEIQAKVDKKINASDHVKYTKQSLTEDQQMQARMNQGLYSTKDTLLETLDLTFSNGQANANLSADLSGIDTIKVIIGDIAMYGTVQYHGHPVYDYTFKCQLGTLHLEYGFGEWKYWRDGQKDFNTTVTVSVYSSENKQVEEKYIPNTIARISDIPQNIVQYSEQTLSEEEQMQARANLGLYYSKETLLETGELAFNENKIADICFGGINNTSCNGKYCKLVLKKDNINIECYGTVEARIYSQAFLLLVHCSFTGKYDGQNFTASYECVEGSGGLTITEIYSSVESSFVSSTWNYELYSVEQNFIPEKYIPDAIARVADVETSLATKLTIPKAASVGQLIKVSAVDEFGKVTATEGQNVAYEDEALDLLYEMKVIDPIAAEDGKILTLESGEILLL